MLQFYRPLLTAAAVFAVSTTLTTGAFGPTTAAAAPPDLPEAEVVGVMPVLMATPNASMGWVGVAALIDAHRPTTGADDRLAGAPTGEGLTGGGFGFAGHATGSDVSLLRFGLAMGLLPARVAMGGVEQARESARLLLAAEDLLAPLTAPAREAVLTALRAAEAGRLDGAAYADALRLAQEGVQAGAPRAHGYLMTGLWAGLALLAGAQDAFHQDLAAMAHPIAAMLEEDARFGGADRTAAAAVRAMGRTLSAGQVNPDDLLRHVEALDQVVPDEAH